MGMVTRASRCAAVFAALLTTGCPDFDKLMAKQGSAARIPDCAFGEPRYLKAAAPAMSAGFGSVLAMDAETLIAVAPMEGVAMGPPRADPPVPTVTCPARPAPFAYSGAVHQIGLDSLDDLGRLPIQGADQIVGGLSLQDVSDAPYLRDNNFALIDAVMSDGRLFVGLGGDANPNLFTGSVRIFVRDGTGFQQSGWLTPPSPEENQGFGAAIAVAGSTLVVGAPAADGFMGAVYVYDLGASGADLPAFSLVPPERQAGALFGGRVAVNDEWIIVGAANETTEHELGSTTGGGAVYAFPRKNLHEPQQLAPTAIDAKAFGVSLALDRNTLLVGVVDADGCPGASAYPGTGAIDRYELSAPTTAHPWGVWRPRECIGAPDDRAALFGWGLAMSKDLLVVGAPFSWSDSPPADGGVRSPKQGTGWGAGLAYVYARQNDGEFAPSCALRAPNAGPCDAFGLGIALDENRLAIGAFAEDGALGGLPPLDHDDRLMDSGAVYLYRLPRH